MVNKKTNLDPFLYVAWMSDEDGKMVWDVGPHFVLAVDATKARDIALAQTLDTWRDEPGFDMQRVEVRVVPFE